MNKKELIEKYTNYNLGGTSRKVLLIRFLRDLDQLNEPGKVKIPQFVAEYIEWAKEEDYHLFGAMLGIKYHENKKVDNWFYTDDNIEIFARAWLDGYEVEKEKRYIVKVKNIGDGWEYLKWNSVQQYWYFGNKKRLDDVRLYHTLENLQKGGFGNVFVNPLFTIEEVPE